DRIHGFPNPEAANNHLQITEKMASPPILGSSFEFIRLPGKPSDLVLHLTIPKSEKVHYTASGECFKRRGPQNLQIREKDIENLLFTKGQHSYEDMWVDSVSADDLKRSEYLQNYLKLVSTGQPAVVFLQKQRLIDFAPGRPLRKTKIRTAAVLLFDDE